MAGPGRLVKRQLAIPAGGVEAGAGLRLHLGRLRIGPGLSWRRMSADTPSSADHAVALGFDLGVAFEFD